MKNLRRTFLLTAISVFLISSCSDKKGGEITVTVAPDESFIIPVPMATCAEIVGGDDTKSYASSSVKFRQLSLEWKEAYQVEIIRISVRFRSGALSSGEKRIEIAGDELTALLTHGTQTPIFPNAGVYTSRPECGLRAGGLGFLPNVGDASVTVLIDVVGVATDESGESFPVYGSGTAFATYLSPN